jgi:hypothetical protein
MAACAALAMTLVQPAGGQSGTDPPAEVHGARVSMIRGPKAAQCPGQNAIVERVRHHLEQAQGEPEGGMVVRATIDVQDGAFVARIVVSGRRSGQRTLRADGPECDELIEALAVSLALILDGTMADSLEPVAPEPEPAIEPKAAAPAVPPRATPDGAFPPPARVVLSPEAERSRPSAWLATGAALTYGIPTDVSGAATLRVAVEYRRLLLALGAFQAPTRTIEFRGGEVDVRLLGGTLSGCARLVGSSDGYRADACGVIGVGEVHGWGRYEMSHEASRPWAALGGGATLRGPIVGPLGWGLGATLLAPVTDERFSVTVDRQAKEVYAPEAAAFFGAAELWVRFL